MADVPGVRWLRSLGRYASDLVQWLWRTQPLLALLAAIVVSSLVWIVFSSCLERRVRLVGMALQLLGVILVAVGLRDTRRAFEDQPTTWQAIKEWWLGRPRFGPRNIVLEAASLAVGVSGGSARMRVSPAQIPRSKDVLRCWKSSMRNCPMRSEPWRTRPKGAIPNCQTP